MPMMNISEKGLPGTLNTHLVNQQVGDMGIDRWQTQQPDESAEAAAWFCPQHNMTK